MGKVRQTESKGVIIGVLSEKNLKIENTSVEGRPCKKITGTFSIETKNGTFKYFVPNFAVELKKDGTKNDTYASWLTVMNEYVSKKDVAEKGGDLVADTVRLSVSFAPYDSYDTNKNEMSHNSSIKAGFISRTSEESTTDINIECVIKGFRNETKKDGEEDVETGRLILDIITIGHGDKESNINEVAHVDTIYVSQPCAFAFTQGYTNEMTGEFIRPFQVGDTCLLRCEVKKVQKGVVSVPTGGFGRQSKVTSGYTVDEIEVFGGETPYNLNPELHENKILEMQDVQRLLNEKEVYLEVVKNKALKKKNASANKPTASVQGRVGFGATSQADGLADPFKPASEAPAFDTPTFL